MKGKYIVKNKTKLLFGIAFLAILPLISHSANNAWDIIDKSMSAWNQNGDSHLNETWKQEKSYMTTTQMDGYVNLKKTSVVVDYIKPSTTPSVTKANTYTVDVKIKTNASTIADTENIFEANMIAISIGGKLMKIYLKHGDENTGYIFDTPISIHKNGQRYALNTAEWHVYRFVYNPTNYTYDVYVDEWDEPYISGLKTHYDGSNSYVRLGAEQNRYCNMDIEYVKFGTGDFSLKSQIRNIEVSSDSHVANNYREITVTVNTDLVDDGKKVNIVLVDESDIEKTTPIEAEIINSKATAQLSMPATLIKGKYIVKAFFQHNKIDGKAVAPKTIDYFIVDSSPLTNGILPIITPIGFIIETEEYQFPAPTNEYIFPCVVDTKEHIDENGYFSDGTKPLDRYYWYHTPHDDPGGMYLYTALTLDGPWVEQGIKLTNDWAKQNGLNTSHISSCHIIWNEVYNKYFMYFHGNNDQTNYAVSNNLIDWTFGGTVVRYDDFSFSSREASYAKVFEYEVPGYNNKYVMMLMINENNARTIYWAYSNDGIEWIGVRKPLISPKTSYKKIPGTNTKPSYSDNVSGPFFMEAGGRYFVFFHSSAGNISIAEIGKKFDMEVHWGTYLSKSDVVISNDGTGNMKTVSRVASPFFIQDDSFSWYLFFEAGHRLGANTAYAKGESTPPTGIQQKEETKKTVTVKKLNNRYILHNSSLEDGIYTVFNLTGNLIKRGTLSSGYASLDVNSGVYIIKIEVGENNFVLKTF